MGSQQEEEEKSGGRGCVRKYVCLGDGVEWKASSSTNTSETETSI